MSQAVSWCFTDNECSEDIWNNVDCKYIVYGREVAPSSGQRHLQGFIVLNKSSRLSAVKKIHPGAHWEVMKGSHIQASTYCKKDGDFVERGTHPNPGKRTDITAACEIVKSHGMKRLAEEMPEQIIKYARNYQIYQNLVSPNLGARDWPMEVEWYYGPTGTGKSRLAAESAGPDAYRKFPGKWWDGYTDQAHVIFDDFRKNWCTFNELLLWFDRYPCRVETKGGSVQFSARKIWVTCHKSPRELYVDSLSGEEREDIEQLIRRISKVTHFDAKYNITN